MTDQTPQTVRIYFLPRTYPCGPNSACCGPIGQTQEEVETLASAIAAEFRGVAVEVIDAGGKLQMGRDLAVMKLLNTFGPSACPILTVGKDVVSMGPPELRELLGVLRSRLEVAEEVPSPGTG